MNSNKENPFAPAAEVLQKLRGTAVRDAKKRNLDLLWDVLNEMYQNKARSFTLSAIGAHLEKAGGPKTQSLRNDGGKDFRDLIEAFVQCLKETRPVKNEGDQSRLDSAIDSLPDIGTRTLFRQMVAENRLLIAQNDRLRSSFKNISFTEPGALAVPECTVLIPSQTVLKDHEKKLLLSGISEDRFTENGWKLRENGSVTDDTGITVLPPGFVHLIRRLAE